MNKIRFQGYDFISYDQFSDQQLSELKEIVESSPIVRKKVLLSGRGAIREGKIDSYGDVVVKQYQRGGMWSHLNKNYYWTSDQSRPEIEYKALKNCTDFGISTPQPIVAIKKGSLLYKAWLVMKKVEYHDNLAALSVRDPDYVFQVLPDVAKNITLLIDNLIFHQDLHPGNVLVTKDHCACLIDFDKACSFNEDKNKLRDVYLLRWRRAVIKHNLPEFLSEFICAELRKSYETDSAIQ